MLKNSLESLPNASCKLGIACANFSAPIEIVVPPLVRGISDIRVDKLLCKRVCCAGFNPVIFEKYWSISEA